MAAEAGATVVADEAASASTKPVNGENGVTAFQSEAVAQGNKAVTHKKLIMYLILIVNRRR